MEDRWWVVTSGRTLGFQRSRECARKSTEGSILGFQAFAEFPPALRYANAFLSQQIIYDSWYEILRARIRSDFHSWWVHKDALVEAASQAVSIGEMPSVSSIRVKLVHMNKILHTLFPTVMSGSALLAAAGALVCPTEICSAEIVSCCINAPDGRAVNSEDISVHLTDGMYIFVTTNVSIPTSHPVRPSEPAGTCVGATEHTKQKRMRVEEGGRQDQSGAINSRQLKGNLDIAFASMDSFGRAGSMSPLSPWKLSFLRLPDQQAEYNRCLQMVGCQMPESSDKSPVIEEELKQREVVSEPWQSLEAESSSAGQLVPSRLSPEEWMQLSPKERDDRMHALLQGYKK